MLVTQMEQSESGATGDGMESLGPGDGGHGIDYEFVQTDKDSLGFVGVDRVKQLKRDVRAQNPTARDVTPALACDPEVNHNDFMDNDMEEDDGDL